MKRSLAYWKKKKMSTTSMNREFVEAVAKRRANDKLKKQQDNDSNK